MVLPSRKPYLQYFKALHRIKLYQSLVLHIYLIAHFDTILFSLYFFILPPKGVQMEKQAKIQ